MQNEHFTTDLVKACELCGLSGDTFTRDTPGAWERLADLYLNIQVAADVIASSDEFDPDNPETFDTSYLDEAFPPGTVTMIMQVATLMALRSGTFSSPNRPARRKLQSTSRIRTFRGSLRQYGFA